MRVTFAYNKYLTAASDKIKFLWAKWTTTFETWIIFLFSLQNEKLKISFTCFPIFIPMISVSRCLSVHYHLVSFLLDLEVYLEQPNATAKEKVIWIRLLDKAVTFDAFNVFPRHCLKCFPFPNQQHCSVLTDLVIGYNWPSITFHSKLIFIRVRNQRKDNATCQSTETNMPTFLERTQGENQSQRFLRVGILWEITVCG